jgi:hypothetical protein
MKIAIDGVELKFAPGDKIWYIKKEESIDWGEPCPTCKQQSHSSIIITNKVMRGTISSLDIMEKPLFSVISDQQDIEVLSESEMWLDVRNCINECNRINSQVKSTEEN